MSSGTQFWVITNNKFPMKFPSTFGWLSAAVATTVLLLLSLTQVAGCGSYALTPIPAPAAAPPESSPNRIQIAFLLDTSSSMDGLIDQAKARLWNILNEILKAEKDGQAPDIEVALYHYGNTTLLPQNGYIEQLSPLTADVDLISEKLFSLKTSGGDEYCGHVILRATDELDWDEEDNTVKIVYIAGNESFNQGEVKAADALLKASEKGITVNTILCGNPNGGDGPSWRAGARHGKGEFFYINQDEKVVFIASPYDEAIEKCNLRLNDTYIPVGNRGASLKENQIRQDVNASSYGQANLSSRTKYKASAKYKNADWDLIDAHEADPGRVLKEKESLPDSLAKLNRVELSAAIDDLRRERRQLQQQIQSLTTQRDQFVAKARNKVATSEKETLGARINTSVRGRLKKAGYKFKE